MRWTLIAIALALAACNSEIEPKAEFIGEWAVVPNRQNPDGERVTMLMNLTGRQKTYPALVIRCRGNKTELMLNWGVNIALNNELGASITHRIGREEAEFSTWALSTEAITGEARSTFYVGDSLETANQSELETSMSVSTIELIQQLIQLEKESESARFSAHALRSEGGTTAGTWDLGGLSRAVIHVRDACDW